jgi:hypothetical protein
MDEAWIQRAARAAIRKNLARMVEVIMEDYEDRGSDEIVKSLKHIQNQAEWNQAFEAAEALLGPERAAVKREVRKILKEALTG